MSNSLESYLQNVMGANGMPLDSYYCPVCKRNLPILAGVITHDNKPHPENMIFEEDKEDES